MAILKDLTEEALPEKVGLAPTFSLKPRRGYSVGIIEGETHFWRCGLKSTIQITAYRPMRFRSARIPW